MKKILFNLLIVVSALCAFSSCKDDDDRDLAMVLSGEWEGNFGAYYTVSINGVPQEPCRAISTILKFEPSRDYSKRGHGTEVDFYGSNSACSEMVYDFRWVVEDGNISIEYINYDGMDLVIDDYKLDSKWFTGTLNGKKFSMEKLSNYYDWTPYDDYFSKHPEQQGSSHEIKDENKN